MKRANGEGTISKRADGLWIGQVTLGYDEFGKAIRKACSAKTQSDCRKKLDSLKKQFALVKSSNVLTTKKSYVDYLLTDWIDEKKNVEQLEDSTIQGIKLPKVHQKEKNSLSDVEVKKILQAAKDYCDSDKTQNKNIFPLIKLALVSGLRRGELAALTWDNIDFEKNKISVTNSVCELKNKIFIKSTKTDASKRSMFIPDFMMKILREHKENFKIGWSEKFSAHFTPHQHHKFNHKRH